MQESEIIVRVVKDDFDRIALEQLTQLGGRSDRNWVDDGTPIARGELEQIDAIEKTMKARALGIECEFLHVRYVVEEAVYLLRLVEVECALRASRRHQPNLVR